jgi:hypothetical protein
MATMKNANEAARKITSVINPELLHFTAIPVKQRTG